MSEDIKNFDAEGYFVIVILSGSAYKFLQVNESEPLVIPNLQGATRYLNEKQASEVWQKYRNHTAVANYDISCIAKVRATVELTGLVEAEKLRRKDAIAKLTPYEKKILGIE